MKINAHTLALFISLLLPTMLLTNASQAHEAGVTDTSIQLGHSSLKMIYTLPTEDLEMMQLVSGSSARQLLNWGFVVKNDNRPCAINNFQQKTLGNINSQQFILLMQCDGPLQNITLNYHLFNQDIDHQNFTRISIAGRNQNITLSADNSSHKIPVAYLLNLWGKKLTDDQLPKETKELEAFPFTALLNGLTQSSHYFSIGLEHILQGYDHVLFLVGLLLLPLAFRQLLVLASAFTLAHSITLALSVLDVARLPSALVEAAIAASIVYVALENLWHLRRSPHKESTIDKLASPWKRRTLMTFLFGLIHGFGFSYLLTEIGLGDQVAGALLYFNLGVEAGQLVIIALAFPLLTYVFKRHKGLVVARFGSLMIGGMGSLWLVERLV